MNPEICPSWGTAPLSGLVLLNSLCLLDKSCSSHQQPERHPISSTSFSSSFVWRSFHLCTDASTEIFLRGSGILFLFLWGVSGTTEPQLIRTFSKFTTQSMSSTSQIIICSKKLQPVKFFTFLFLAITLQLSSFYRKLKKLDSFRILLAYFVVYLCIFMLNLFNCFYRFTRTKSLVKELWSIKNTICYGSFWYWLISKYCFVLAFCHLP